MSHRRGAAATCQVEPPDPACDDLNANGSATLTTSSSFMDPGAPAFSLDGEVGGGPLTFIGAGPVIWAHASQPEDPA